MCCFKAFVFNFVIMCKLIDSYCKVEVTVNWEPRKKGCIVNHIMAKHISTSNAKIVRLLSCAQHSKHTVLKMMCFTSLALLKYITYVL
jgi:hypothetical protein